MEKQRKEVTVIIYFDENLFSFACKDIHGDNLVLELVDYDKCEIIGNIHDEALKCVCFFKRILYILAYACENIISGWSVYLDIEGVNDVELSKKEILERARQYEEMKERKQR